MAMKILYGLQAKLSAPLAASDVVLPVCPEVAVWIHQQLGTSDHAWIVIRDTVGAEVVRLSVFGGVLSIERGRDGTQPRNFPPGACVSGEMTGAAVKDLLCHYDCCAEPQCGEVFE